MPRPIVITGGGTGGHIFPMQAIAEQLIALGLGADDLRFVGSRRGQERTLLASSDVALTLLPGRGIQRSMAPRAMLDNLGATLGLVTGVAMAVVDVARWRPAAVVSVGGYASFAVSLAAVLWRRPLVLVDLDATPGAAHRLLARFARARCSAFPSPDPEVIVTGAPVRDAIINIDRSPAARTLARESMQPPVESGRVVVVVMTGSLGAARVNEAVSELATRWRDREDVTLVHVTGRRDFGVVTERRPETTALDYRIVEFADMTILWAACDVAVCRAGALTVAELTMLAIPAVLVPLPGAPGDHQGANARRVVEVGGALLLADPKCTGATLDEALHHLMNPETRTKMSESIHRLARHDAAREIAQVVSRIGLRR